MKVYELIQTDEGSIVKAAVGEKILWIPLDPANSDYAEYLRYTAWVEAGNDPDEFWAQSEDFAETEEN
jgi:hypothetical protein